MRDQTLPRYLQLIKSLQFEILNYLSLKQHKYVHFSSTVISWPRGFNNFGDKRLFEVEQTAVIEKGP